MSVACGKVEVNAKARSVDVLAPAVKELVQAGEEDQSWGVSGRGSENALVEVVLASAASRPSSSRGSSL